MYLGGMAGTSDQQQMQLKIQVKPSEKVTFLSESEYAKWLPTGVHETLTEIFGKQLNIHALKRVAAISHLLFDTTYVTPVREAARTAISSSSIQADSQNYRQDKFGKKVTKGDDHSILTLAYFIALKEIKFGGEDISPIQSSWASRDRAYDVDYEDAVNLLISYLNGEGLEAEKAGGLSYDAQRKKLQCDKPGVLKQVANSLIEAPPSEGTQYTTLQSLTILAHLKSSADLVFLEMDIQDSLAVNIDQQNRDINKLNISIGELHQMFLDLAGIVRSMGQTLVNTSKHIDKAYQDTAEATLRIMEADRIQAKTMPFAAWIWPPVTKAQVNAQKEIVKNSKNHTILGPKPSYYDRVKDSELGRAYHNSWNADSSPLLSDKIKHLMDNYRAPGGIFSNFARTHSKRAQKVKEAIDNLPNKEDPKHLGRIIKKYLEDLDNNTNEYSAFRARCNFILNQLDNMMTPDKNSQDNHESRRPEH